VRQAIIGLPESAWIEAIRPDGKSRKHSQVAETTDLVDLSAWPEGSRLIARRTKLREDDQQSFQDHDGYRLAVFVTDQQGENIARLDLIHRGHARVEDRIRESKGCGLSNLSFKSFRHNQVWLAGAARPRPDRLGQAAVVGRRGTRVGAQAAALPPASPVRADRPPRAAHDPAPRA